MKYFKNFFSFFVVILVVLLLTPKAEAALLVSQATVNSGDTWTVDYNNGQTFEFDMNYTGQWPVLTCKASPSGSVSVWFQSNEVYAKTSSGYSKRLGGISSSSTQHYKVVCNNDVVAVYVNGGFLDSATDSSIDVPSSSFINQPRVDFVANGSTQMTNFTISDSDSNSAPVITSLTVPTGTQLQYTPVNISANFTDAEAFNTHTATISWGDGNTSTDSVTENNGAGSITGSHAYSNGGDYTIRVTVTDQDGASVSEEEPVHVNLSPAVSFVNASGDSSSMYIGTGSFSDSDPDSTSWTGAVDYGDGTGSQALQIDNQNSTFSLDHKYSSGVSNTITVVLTDNQGQSSSQFSFSSKLLVTQPKVYSGNSWTVNYNNGQVFEFDMNFVSQWPVLTCKNSASGNVAIWFQGRQVYAKTSSGFSQQIGNIEPNNNSHYKVVCKNDTVSLYVDGSLAGEATDNSMNVPSTNFVNNPSVSFVANGDTQVTNFTIANLNPPQPITTTFDSSADTYVKRGNDNRNTGAGTFMRVQSSRDNRSLVRFDQSAMQSEIGNKQVLSAKLRVTITDNGNNWGTTGRTIDVHRLISNWAEGNGTENDRGSGNGATWSCAIDSLIENQTKNCSGTTEWEMGQPNNPAVHPWVQTASATQNITNSQSGVVEFDVTADVANFLSSTNQNYGWIIKKTAEGQSGQVSFGTKESSSVPQLVVTYQP